MGKMVPPPPPRNSKELLEQIKMLENRRRQLQADKLVLIATAFGAGIVLIILMFVTL